MGSSHHLRHYNHFYTVNNLSTSVSLQVSKYSYHIFSIGSSQIPCIGSVQWLDLIRRFTEAKFVHENGFVICSKK